VSAHLKVYHDPVSARQYLRPLLDHLGSYGVGSLGEIFEGDPPFRPVGCIAQAWSVAEVLRAWRETMTK
jgi:glycogen debranching enzyme